MWVPLMTYWSISSISLEKEARKLWLEVEIIAKNKNLFYIIWEWKKILFKSSDFWWNSSLWLKICNDKELTYKILEKNNLPIAKSIYLYKKDYNNMALKDYVKELNFPLVIKPLEDWHWNWVITNIINISSLNRELKSWFKFYDKLAIQEQIEWDEVRLLVFKWKVILAINRKPAYIIWDWKNNIEKLITIENNSNKLRWDLYKSLLSFIKIDNELINFLNKTLLSLKSIPKSQKEIQLRWNSNLWTWWVPINVTSIISEDIKNIAIKTSKILNLEICWVDIITYDITKTLAKTWWVILEVNATPWVWSHKELLWINTSRRILKTLFKIN